MKPKLLTVVCLLTVIAIVLAGCGSGPPSPTTTTTPTGTAPTTESKTPTPTTATTIPLTTSTTPSTSISPTTPTPPITTTTTTPLPAFRITTLSNLKAAPMSSLVINGAGFDPSADIQVRFFDKTGFSESIPPSDVKATSLTVGVPPYTNPGTEAFGTGIVDVQIVQTSKTNTLTTNTIEGLQITDIPAYTGTTGAATLEYLDELIQLIRDSQYHLYCLEQISDGAVTDPVLTDCLSKLEADYLEVKSQVQSIIADPKKSTELATITLPTGEIFSMTLNFEAISTIDRLISLYNQRLSSVLNTKLTLTPSTKFVFASWKSEGIKGVELQATESSSSQEWEWRVHSEYTQKVQQKLKTANDCATIVAAIANPVKSSSTQDGTVPKPMARDKVATGWLASTFVTGVTAMAQDYSAASAATGGKAWTEGRDFISEFFSKLVNYVVTGKFESTNESFRDLTPDAAKKNSAGRLISQSPLANSARQDATEDTGRFAQDSGLNLIYYSDRPYTDSPPAPDNIMGLWTGSGWSYDCCSDDGTRRSKVSWAVSIFIIEQKVGGAVRGRLTMKVVKQERIDPEYYETVNSTWAVLFTNGITNNRSFTFSSDDKDWTFFIGTDMYTMDGSFDGPGPGIWCVGNPFHLEKFR